MGSITEFQMPFTTERELPKAVIDPILKDDYAGAIQCVWDMGDVAGYPSQLPPTNGAVVNDLTGGTGGSIVVGAGSQGFSGGGMVMTGVTAAGTYISLPSRINASIWNPYNGLSQLFGYVLYVKLASQANWNAQSSIMPLMDGGGSYASQPDMALLCMQSNGQIAVRRQVAAATYDSANTLGVLPAASDYGTFAQIAYWRNQDGQRLRLRTIRGVTWAGGNPNGVAVAKGADNTQNFASVGPRMGWTSLGSASTPNGLNGLKFYRGWIDNLAKETRDFVTLIDRDFRYTAARGVFL